MIPALGSGRYAPGPNIVWPSWLNGSDPNYTINACWRQPGLPATVSYSTRISCCGISRRLGVHDHSGKKKDHTIKNVLLVNALLLILFLSDTYGRRTHDKPIADATPYPLPAGSRLLQDLGFLAFTLPQ